jgi:ADP-heptose:LPS heptosyltransferase
MLVASAQSDQKIAWSSAHHSYIPNLPEADAIMHKTMHSDKAIALEYLRNLEFVEKVLSVPVDYTVQSPFAQFKKHNHLIIFPVASSNARNWPVQNYAQVIHRMQSHFSKIIVLGGPNSIAFSEALKSLCKQDQYIDLCAQTTLLDLMTFIGEANVLLTPDSAALHYGVLTATNTVVISNATNWQRFTDYQPYVKHKVKVVYPEWMRLNPSQLKLQYSHTEIKSISVNQICEAILSVKS